MPWTATVVTDMDKENVGNATATYTEVTEVDGVEEIAYSFTYSERVELTQEEKVSFSLKAKQALADKRLKDTKDTNLSTILTTELNKE